MLKNLRLECPTITNFNIVKIAECCPKLDSLYLQCPAITDNAILSIVEGCLMLHSVHFMNYRSHHNERI